MSKRKASSYDPTAVKTKVAKRMKNIKEIERLGLEFLSAINDIAVEDSEKIISSFTNESVVELALTALLGLKGIETARFAYFHVPNSYCNLKSKLIARIMSTVCRNVSQPEAVCASACAVLKVRYYFYNTVNVIIL